MRTRIALVAIIPVALITVTTLTQAASVQSARAITPSIRTATSITAMPDHQLTAFHKLTSSNPAFGQSGLLLDLNMGLVGRGVTNTTTKPGAPVTAAPAPAASTSWDTVTPYQRAAWERVAMCEESGNWAADGSVFSGGLGISRANWAAFGGYAFASEGAMATEDEQILVAERIQSSPPDQGGCAGW
jgi:hypothetical protein